MMRSGDWVVWIIRDPVELVMPFCRDRGTRHHRDDHLRHVRNVCVTDQVVGRDIRDRLFGRSEMIRLSRLKD